MLNDILILIAGFGVFLFGIQTLSSNLEKAGGNNMRKTINKFSGNRFSAMGLGFAFAALFQSGKASVILVAGFASAGIINLFQGMGLVIGSNIAATLPNFLISFTTFNITTFFCTLSAVGFFMILLSKKPILKDIGAAIVGFSLMFIGMFLIRQGTASFSTNPVFINFFSTLTNPVLLILLGTAFTCITQNALATIAVIMTLIGTSAAPGIITIETAACLVYGAHLGTAITTAIIVGISSNIEGKRLGLYHVLFSITGVIIFGLLTMVPWIDALFSWIPEPAFKISFINLTFNVVVALIMLPLMKPFMLLIRKILPGRKSQKNPLTVDEIINEIPAVTLAKANEKIVLFFDSILLLYKRTCEYISDLDNKKYKKLLRDLSNYNTLINKFNMYVIRITTTDTQKNVNLEIESLINIIKQTERINRNCIKTLAVLKKENKKIIFSQKLSKFIEKIGNNTLEMFDLTKQFIQNPDCKFLENGSPSKYDQILQLSHENSETKLTAKKFIIETGFNSKISIEKNTSYIELMGYLGLISNNLLDIVFSIVGKANISVVQDISERSSLKK